MLCASEYFSIKFNMSHATTVLLDLNNYCPFYIINSNLLTLKRTFHFVVEVSDLEIPFLTAGSSYVNIICVRKSCLSLYYCLSRRLHDGDSVLTLIFDTRTDTHKNVNFNCSENSHFHC